MRLGKWVNRVKWFNAFYGTQIQIITIFGRYLLMKLNKTGPEIRSKTPAINCKKLPLLIVSTSFITVKQTGEMIPLSCLLFNKLLSKIFRYVYSVSVILSFNFKYLFSYCI